MSIAYPTVAQRFRVQPEVHVERADVWHILIAEQQPGYRTADDGEFSFEASQDLADLDQYGLHGGCRTVVVVGGRLGFEWCHFDHVSFSRRR